MSKPAKKTQQLTKVKKKVWIPIIAPKMFNEQMVGETPANSAQESVGRVVEVNLMILTGESKKQSINAKLIITEIKEGKAHTKLIRYEINPPSIKRLVRRKKNRIDESLVYQTKDGQKVRIKPFILTVALTKSSVVSEIRKRIKVFLYKTIAQTTYEDLFRMVIDNKLQRELGQSISKMHPIKTVEIRVLHLENINAKITPPPMLKEKPKEEDPEKAEKIEASKESKKKEE